MSRHISSTARAQMISHSIMHGAGLVPLGMAGGALVSLGPAGGALAPVGYTRGGGFFDDVWGGMKSAASTVWDKAVAPVLGGLGQGVGSILAGAGKGVGNLAETVGPKLVGNLIQSKMAGMGR